MTESPDFAVKPTLVGDSTVLRPFAEADLPAIREALLDPEARILTGSVHDEAADTRRNPRARKRSFATGT